MDYDRKLCKNNSYKSFTLRTLLYIIHFNNEVLFEMIYITFNRNPFPWMSVSDKILPPDMLFNILVVA